MKDFVYNNREITLKVNNIDSGEIGYGWSDSPFGKVLIFLKSDMIVGMAFKNNTNNNIEYDMKARWDQKTSNFKNLSVKQIADKVFNSNLNLT